MAQEGQTATNPRTGERVILRGGQWVPLGGSAPLPTATIPAAAPNEQAKNNADLQNIGSTITSRAVGDVNTNANTNRTVVQTEKDKLDLQSALEARARGVVVEDAATTEIRNQLQAVRNARGYVNNFSTGSIGGLIGRPDNSEGKGGTGLSGLPILGEAIYAGSDRAGLDAALGTLRSAAKFNMIQTLKERGAAQGSQGTGLGATAIPEFEALGRVNFNLEPDALAAGPDFLKGELSKAEETLLRRYAAVTLPSSVLVNATPEERKRLLEASYQQAVREYQNNFDPNAGAAPGGGQGGNGGPGGGAAPEGAINIAKGETRVVQDPAFRGLNDTVATMIRNGAKAEDIVSVIRERRQDVTPDLLAQAQQAVEYYKPYVGKPLPPTVGAPPVSLETRLENVGLGEQVAGRLADNPVGAAVIGAANGITLGGLDELIGATSGMTTAEADALKRYFSDNYGTSYTLGNIAGGVAGAVPMVRGAGAAATALGAGARGVRAAQAGANILGGTAAGALESNQDRGTGALLGGGMALGGDLLGTYLGGKIAPRLFDAPTKAEQAVVDNLVNPDAARGVLAEGERLGMPVLPVDADPGLRGLGYFSRANSAQADRTLDATLTARNDAAKGRAVLAVEQNLAPVTDVKKLGKDIQGAARLEAAPLKERAFAQQPPVDDPVISEILQTPTGRQALERARKIAADERRDPDELGLVWQTVRGPDETVTRTIQKPGPLGEPIQTTEQVPVPGRARDQIVALKGSSWETLDYMRRGLDAVLDSRRNPITGKLEYDRAGETTAIEKLRRDFSQRMRTLNEDYGAYVDTLAGPYSNAEQLRLGSKFMAPELNAAQLQEVVSGLSGDQLEYYRLAAGNALIDRLKRPGNSWNTLRSDKNIDLDEKLRVLFPGEKLDKINELADFERLMQKTKDRIVGNSDTQIRQNVQESVSAGAANNTGALAAETAMSVATGGKSAILTSLVRMGRLGFKDAQRLEQVRANEALANDLLPILTEADPAKATKMINDILKKADTYNKKTGRLRVDSGAAGAAATRPILAE